MTALGSWGDNRTIPIITMLDICMTSLCVLTNTTVPGGTRKAICTYSGLCCTCRSCHRAENSANSVLIRQHPGKVEAGMPFLQVRSMCSNLCISHIILNSNCVESHGPRSSLPPCFICANPPQAFQVNLRSNVPAHAMNTDTARVYREPWG